MRVFVGVLAASILLSAPVAFGQTGPNGPAPSTLPAPTEPTANSGSTATPATPDAETGNQQATDADHRVTCRIIQTTESRLRRSRQRVCGTRQQWEQLQDQSSEGVRGMGHVQGQSG